MVKLSKSIILILFILGFLSILISTNEIKPDDQKNTESNTPEHLDYLDDSEDHENGDLDAEHEDLDFPKHHEKEHFNNEGFDSDENLKGNLLDEGGQEIIESLGYNIKESLTKEELKVLFEKLFFRREIDDEEEKNFYTKMIESVSNSLPESILMKDLRNYFDVEYLMKFVEEGMTVNDHRMKDSL